MNIIWYSDNQAPVVQRVDNAIHWINRYPVDKCWRKKLRYPLDSDLSGDKRYPPFEQPAPGWNSIELKHCQKYVSMHTKHPTLSGRR